MTRPHRVAVALLCTVALFVLPSWALRHDRASAVHERAAALEELERRNADLREENARILENVTTLSDGEESNEAVVRDRLGWVKPNETIIEFGAPDGAEE